MSSYDDDIPFAGEYLDFAELSRDELQAKLLELLTLVETSRELLRAKDDDDMAGQRGAFLHDLYLRPAYRGRGLGRALLAEVCRATRNGGGRFVWWCMIDGNHQASGFYRQLAKPLDDLKIWIAEGETFERLAGVNPSGP